MIRTLKNNINEVFHHQKYLFMKKKELQPSSCRHGKPHEHFGLHAKVEG